MFQKVLASLGSGGAKVDARIIDPAVRPGGTLRGEVLLTGGQVDQQVESLGVSVLARVETGNTTADLPVQSVHLAGRELIRAGSQITVPFEVQLPWETPVTSVLGKHLTGMAVGLQTNLDLAGSVVDPQDVDAIPVEPLPAQHRILDAMSRIGFQFRGANLEKNRLDGVDQQLPFFQEITFTPSPAFAQAFAEVTVTFLARPQDVQVVLDVVKKVRVAKGGGLGSRSQSMLGSFVVQNATLAQNNWEKQLEAWFHQVAAPRGIFD
ncbi:sporulation-control protein [Actinokineospora alba]|uniref:Sporulation-control protein n=1 Tax=Actinokineospora alba TaxID=504798 RepID=A0A1H0JCZ2_9PSEU|nr:sporulation protein [Actinokineospora alba]TDP68347.1 sporulation-control protein [Actinokineospora alba]SDH77192.1 sporulation-control protein [Actinokineospora alba]SDO41329.1 sporulation-control protein [Actinokineospora alba]